MRAGKGVSSAWCRACGGGNIDAGRHSIERLDPVAYLRNGYYGRWYAALERTLLECGVVTPEELRARLRGRRRRTAKDPRARRSQSSRWQAPSRGSYARDVARPALFRDGQRSARRTTSRRGTRGSRRTRAAGAVRSSHLHAAMVYPDDHAHGRGENPQYLYTVRFDGARALGRGRRARHRRADRPVRAAIWSPA